MRVLTLFCAVFAMASVEAAPPNVVLIITDDQGYPTIGRHEHPWLQTPHLDRLHDESIRFTRFLVSPTCSPTRSALMTGRHSMRNGVTHTILERERLTLDAITLPELLSEAVYQTGIFGKWHLGDEEPYQPHRRGFQEAFIHGAGGIGQAYDCSCADAPDNSYFNPVIRHNLRFVKATGFCTDVFFSAAAHWINRARTADAPFFAYIAPNAPHGPYFAPDDAKQRFLECGFSDEQAAFYGMIENIDANVGRLMQSLDDWNLSDNTIVIFMSDNGMTGGGSGKVGSVLGRAADGTEMKFFNAGMKGLKNSVDEGGVRVPFFVRYPSRWKTGRDVNTVAADIDILPTVLGLTVPSQVWSGESAARVQRQVEGRDLSPLMSAPEREWPDRMLFTHIGRWSTGSNPDDHQWSNFSVRSQRFRFVNNSQLFDMDADPGQTTNVIESHPNVVAEFRAAYDDWWKTTRPLMVNEDAPMSPTRPFHELYRAQLDDGGIPDWDGSSED